MDNIQKTIELQHKRKTAREVHFTNIERQQVAKYNNVMERLQTLKGLQFYIK